MVILLGIWIGVQNANGSKLGCKLNGWGQEDGMDGGERGTLDTQQLNNNNGNVITKRCKQW